MLVFHMLQTRLSFIPNILKQLTYRIVFFFCCFFVFNKLLTRLDIIMVIEVCFSNISLFALRVANKIWCYTFGVVNAANAANM